VPAQVGLWIISHKAGEDFCLAACHLTLSLTPLFPEFFLATGALANHGHDAFHLLVYSLFLDCRGDHDEAFLMEIYGFMLCGRFDNLDASGW
jgi:hypothetical protein